MDTWQEWSLARWLERDMIWKALLGSLVGIKPLRDSARELHHI